jgi:hypothetical protein
VRRTEIVRGGWDEENGVIAFWLDVYVALGYLERADQDPGSAPEEDPAHSWKKREFPSNIPSPH